MSVISSIYSLINNSIKEFDLQDVCHIEESNMSVCFQGPGLYLEVFFVEEKFRVRATSNLGERFNELNGWYATNSAAWNSFVSHFEYYCHDVVYEINHCDLLERYYQEMIVF